jgi:hypothetical protein
VSLTDRASDKILHPCRLCVDTSGQILADCSSMRRVGMMDCNRFRVLVWSVGNKSRSQCKACTTRIAGRPAQYRRLGAVSLNVIVSLPSLMERMRASV